MRVHWRGKVIDGLEREKKLGEEDYILSREAGGELFSQSLALSMCLLRSPIYSMRDVRNDNASGP
jgi:hypothetical protein